MSTGATDGRILKARKGDNYRSCADGAVLDEDLPNEASLSYAMNPWDVLFFRFDVLHRSLRVSNERRSRWTVQSRYADLADAEFRQRAYKPSSVNKIDNTFLQEGEQ